MSVFKSELINTNEGIAPAALPIEAREPRSTSQPLRDLLQDSFGYLATKVVPGFFGLISVPIFVRLVGVNEYGRLSVLLPVLLALAGAGSGWIQQGALRFHPPAEESSRQDSPFNHAVQLGTFYSVLVLCFVLIPILASLHYHWQIWIIAEVYCAIQLFYLVHLTLLQGQLRPRSVLKNEAVRSSVGFMAPAALLLLSPQKTFSLIILGLTLGYAVPLLFVRRQKNTTSPPVVRDSSQGQTILGKLWRFGWAVGVWLMLVQALPIVGRSAISRYAGYAEAGIYASLYELAVRSFSLFAAPVTQAAHPRIMQYWNAGEYSAARRTIAHAIRMQLLMFLPIEAAGIVFAAPLTRLALGTDTPTSISLLPLLMLGGFLWQIALLVHKPLEIMQRTKAMLFGMVGVVVIELAGNYMLVPLLGIKAVVYVFVAGAVAYIAFAGSHAVVCREQFGGADC